MNIALIGYGKMGHMIEAAALERQHRIAAYVDPVVSPAKGFTSVAEMLASGIQIDVAIEFTRPDTAISNIEALVNARLPVVVGTTGWYAGLPEIAQKVQEKETSLLWSSNFSIGVQLFFRIASYAAKLFNEYEEYDVGGFEAHHNKKADSPSGTAKTLVERALKELDRKTTPVYDTLNRPPRPEELHFSSLRVGSVPGTHSLFFDSTADTIELTHTARSREGFARGAVRAAEWLVGCIGPGGAGTLRRNGVFTMDDVLAHIDIA
ncbi:MAG: 4-hydroxy-tetrahydrodipicolinate reductase [Treponema sp.]|nr:4-hydroxy-tetrahydrodipicolinate reductase [Treponema sp.]